MNTNIKAFLIVVIIGLIIANETSAQSAFEAGVRFGNEFSIDATFPLSKAPRLHTAFYVQDGFDLGLYLDWLFSLDGGPQGLKFFPGVGPELYFTDGFDLGIAGDFGVEYSFRFPLTVGIDYRPGFMVTDNFKFYSKNWGITARFRFISAN